LPDQVIVGVEASRITQVRPQPTPSFWELGKGSGRFSNQVALACRSQGTRTAEGLSAMADRDQFHASNRGFAAMDEKKQREIASKGGQASGGNFKNDPGRASEAGRKGGQSVPASERSFSRDPRLAAEAGRKGGEHSHGGVRVGSKRPAATA
jgi:uncharacterized protein